jgi:hypothetical protein
VAAAVVAALFSALAATEEMAVMDTVLFILGNKQILSLFIKGRQI